jgi:hypothetical protein
MFMAMPNTIIQSRPRVNINIQHIGLPFFKLKALFTEQRSRSLKTDLIPDENPPKMYRTPDGIEWQFIQTFADYDEMNTFREENQCRSRYDGEKWCRIRFVCKRTSSHNCKFMLLAMKTTKQEYHFYKHGEHNHNDNNEDELAQRSK